MTFTYYIFKEVEHRYTDEYSYSINSPKGFSTHDQIEDIEVQDDS